MEETERRQRQVETLRSKLMILNDKFLKMTRSDRDTLIGADKGTSLWENEDDVPIIPSTNSSSLNIRDSHVRIMEEQNRGLDVLSQTISRQRDLASRFGTEVVDQNNILDNIGDNMDRLDGGVNQETGRITNITRQDKTWGNIFLMLFFQECFTYLIIFRLLAGYRSTFYRNYRCYFHID